MVDAVDRPTEAADGRRRRSRARRSWRRLDADRSASWPSWSSSSSSGRRSSAIGGDRGGTTRSCGPASPIELRRRSTSPSRRTSSCPTRGTSRPSSWRSMPRGDDRCERLVERGVVHPAERGHRVRPGIACSACGLAIVLVHVRILERALVPIIVASQTIPIIAIAPLIVIGLKADWFGVAIVATYLTFFPVTIAALRGLRAYDPRAIELMRSYAASRGAILRKLRLPALAPYLFTGVPDRRPAAVVGAIVGELPSLIQDGLGAPDHHRDAVLLAQRRIPVGGHRHVGRCSASGSTCWSSGSEAWVMRHERAPEAVGRMTTADAATEAPRRPRGRSSRSRASPRSSPRAAGRRTGRGPDRHRPVHRAGRVHLAHRAVGLWQVHAAADHRRPDRADRRARSRSTARPRTRRAATATTGWSSRPRSCSTGGPSRATSSCRSRSTARQGRTRRGARRSTSRWSSCPTSPATTRGSCRVACSSASPSPGRSPSTRRSCSWTSRSARSTR